MTEANDVRRIADGLRALDTNVSAALRARALLALANVPTHDDQEGQVSAACATYATAVSAYSAATAERASAYGPASSTDEGTVNGATNVADTLYDQLADPITGLWHQLDVLQQTQVGSTEEDQFLIKLRQDLGV